MLELMTKFFLEMDCTGGTEKAADFDSFSSDRSAGSKNSAKPAQLSSNGDKYLTHLTRPTTAAITSRRGEHVLNVLFSNLQLALRQLDQPLLVKTCVDVVGCLI